MANLAQQAGVALNRALEDLLKGSPKSSRTSQDTRSKGAAPLREELSEGGKRNVATMMEAGMSAVVTCIETRVSAVEDTSELLSVRMAAVESKLDETRNLLDATRRDLSEFKDMCLKKHHELEELYKAASGRIDALVVPPRGNSTPNAQSSSEPAASVRPTCNADVPYELRSCAKIGNFPYDTARDNLEA